MSGRPVTAWVARCATADGADRPAMLEQLVIGEFRRVLLLGDGETLALDTSYLAQGLTSLGAVEIQQRLEAVLGRPIDTAALLNHPTVTYLLRHLRGAVLPDLFVHLPAAHSPRGRRGTAVPRSVVDDALSDLYPP